MAVLITITSAGSSTGPFNLYSNTDGFTIPFETNIPKANLLSGYNSVLVPVGTTIVQIKSLGTCTNSINIGVSNLPTTTVTPTSTTSTTLPITTTTISPTSTTSTTSTTTTTLPVIACGLYTVATTAASGQTYTYTDCEGLPQSGTIGGVSGFDSQTFCAQENSVIGTGETNTTYDGPCSF
jgi:hypothetical protein